MNEMIGRKNEKAELETYVFGVAPAAGGGKSQGICYSIIGPHGIGKTYLVDQLIQEFNTARRDHVYIVQTRLGTAGTGSGTSEDAPVAAYWKATIADFSDVIGEAELTAAPGYRSDDRNSVKAKEAIEKVYAFFQHESVDPTQVGRNVEKYFKSLKTLGIRTILVIDEFDLAKKLFKTETFFSILFSLSPKGIGLSQLDLSILLLSRRDLASQSFLTGSSFDSGFPSLVLAGFNNAELEEYWKTYQELPCGVPDEETRQLILNLCGRAPGLLTCARTGLSIRPDEVKSTQWVYDKCIKAVRDNCSRIAGLMKEEKLQEDEDVSYLDVFIQTFIGPAYDKRILKKMEAVRNHGFVCKKDDKAGGDIFTLAGLDEMAGVERLRKLDHEPLSPYFLEYIREDVLPTMEKNIVVQINAVERKVRDVIHDTLRDRLEKKGAYPNEDALEDALEKAVCEGLSNPGKKQGFKNSLTRAIEDNRAGERGFRACMVNVLSFPEYYEIIQHYSEIMSPYFSNFKSVHKLRGQRADLGDIFQKLKSVRDLGQHQNIEIVAPGDLPELIQLCDELLNNMDSPNFGEVWKIPAKPVDGSGVGAAPGTPTDAAPGTPAAPATAETIEIAWVRQLREVTISDLFVTNSLGLVGYFTDEENGKQYKVCISMATLVNNGFQCRGVFKPTTVIKGSPGDDSIKIRVPTVFYPDHSEVKNSDSMKVTLTQFSKGDPKHPDLNPPHFQGVPVKKSVPNATE